MNLMLSIGDRKAKYLVKIELEIGLYYIVWGLRLGLGVDIG